MGLNVLVPLDQIEQKSRGRNLFPNISGEARSERHIARQKKYIDVLRENFIVITKRNLLHDYLSLSIAFLDAILER